MESLRKRIPFKPVDPEDDDHIVLDEQQQEAIIADLRKQIEFSNKSYYLLLKILVGASLALQLLTIRSNPLMGIFPVTYPDASLPAPATFALLSLFIHLNCALFFLPDEARTLLHTDSPPTPLSFQMLYCLSLVAPTFSFFLNKPWQTTIWWCITPFIVFVVQTVVVAIHANSADIAHVERLKYNAPGA